MKIRSVSISGAKIILLFVLLFLVLVIYAALPRIKGGLPDAARVSGLSYHQSAWNEYAPEIERVAKSLQSAEPAKLNHIYGGVVSHHIPTTIPRLVEFYSRLKQTQNVKNIIIIGPDHTDSGRSPITVSNSSFFTAYGQVKPVEGLALKLQSEKLADIYEAPFDREHSVGSQILIISRMFPGANVTPIIVRSDTSINQAEQLGKLLANYMDAKTVFIASVDFSHYLPTGRAFPIDRISADVIRNLDLESLSSIETDSRGSVAAFMEVMKAVDATSTADFTVLNTNDLMQNSDFTTGYVFGYWGR